MPQIDDDRKISVCCVSQSFLPFIGGLARYVEALGKQFLRRGHDFRVIHFKTPSIQAIDFSSGIEMIRANVPKVGDEALEKYLLFKEQILEVTHEEVGPDYVAHDGYKEYLEVNERLAQDVADAYNYKPFDLLHVHDFQTLPLARILRRKFGLKIAMLFTWHVPFVSAISPWWKEFFISHMSDYGKVVLSTQEYVNAAVNAGLAPEKATRISPFIDLDIYKVKEPNFVRQKYGLAEGEFIVLCVSRIDPRKGQEILIDAIGLLVNQMKTKNLKCVFVGNGSFSSELLRKERGNRLHKLQEMTRQKDLETRIVFTGKLEGEELNQMFDSSDVVVQPSLQEGFGLTISEGMAFKKPVVGSRVGGIPEQIEDGLNGFLFEKGNSMQLAEKLFSLSQEHGLGKVMGERGFEIVKQKFSSEMGYAEHMKLYKEALEKKQE